MLVVQSYDYAQNYVSWESFMEIANQANQIRKWLFIAYYKKNQP